jgi:hypothetical protein
VPIGEVGRHAVTYEIKEGRLVPKTTSLSLNRVKQPPKKGTTINNNLSVVPLRR